MTSPAGPTPPLPALPSPPPRGGFVELAPMPKPGPRRDDDRQVAVASVVVAAAYLAAAAVAAVGGAVTGSPPPPWLALHLALTGGASTAIAGVMPFFAATLVAGHPADRRLRTAAVALVATGAALVAMRAIVPATTLLPPIGGTVYLAGIGATAMALRTSGRRGLMVRRPIVTVGYSLALANVAVGASLAILFSAGWAPVVDRWVQLKPAHAWSNVLGFVSLVITATLLHFLPTVLGTRIVARRSAIFAVLGLAVGSPLVVAGFLAGWGPLAGGGAAVSVVGAWSLVVEVAATVRARGRWTTDAGWHRMSGVALTLGPAWLAAGVTVAAARIAWLGTGPDAWSTTLVGVPLGIGWAAQVLVGSWTHLLPAIGPGGPVLHARRRAILGRLATPRLVALNGGAAMAAIGWPTGNEVLAGTGVLLAAGAILASGAIAGIALRERAPA